MNQSELILKEENPYLREFWANGYTHFTHDFVCNDYVFYGENKMMRITSRELLNEILNLKIIRGLLPNGKIHSWISEADGSAERFRDFINSKKQNDPL